MIPTKIIAAAIHRRAMRWEKEKAAGAEREAGKNLAAEIAAWRKTDAESLTFSNTMCLKAPSDLGCVFVKSWNPMRNPCVFCGSMEEDIF